jgi:hypothetical protein
MALEWPKVNKTGTKTDDPKVHYVNLYDLLKTPTATSESLIISTIEESQLERRAIKFIRNNKAVFDELAKL